uniref:Uncharacterized protein MANES_09G148800 n=1 Tax=Rhizophora mucronata TaxID=61149 RepID=A0A2P2JF44_RHIMU
MGSSASRVGPGLLLFEAVFGFMLQAKSQRKLQSKPWRISTGKFMQ